MSISSRWLSCILLVIFSTPAAKSVEQCQENCQCLKQNLTLNTCPTHNIDYLNIEITSTEIKILCNELISPSFEDVPSFDANYLTFISDESPLTLSSMIQRCSGTLGKRIIYRLNPKRLSSVTASENILEDNKSIKYLKFINDRDDVNVTLLQSKFLTYGSHLNTLIINRLGIVKLGNYLRNLSHIETLDLGSNNIKELDDLVFQNLTNLTTLIMHNNKIDLLQGTLFKELKQLRILDLSMNKLQNLRKDMLIHVANIHFLNFSCNNLKTIENNTFWAFSNLKQLDLSQNPNLTLMENTFRNLTSLRSLNLSGCSIDDIQTGFLQGSPDLTALNVSRNAITHLKYNSFENLQKLAIIDLSYNNINYLNNALFQPLKNLREILLNFNQLKSFNFDLFGSIQTLRMIDLSGNLISSLTNSSSKFKANTIILANNHLDQFPEFLISDVIGLRHLDLRYNRIASVEIRKGRIPEMSQNVQMEIYVNNNLISKFNAEKLVDQRNNSSSFPQNWKITMDLSENLLQCNCLKYEIEQLSPNRHESVILEVSDKENICYTSYPNYNCPLIEINNCPKECNCYYTRIENAIVVDCAGRNISKYPVIQKLYADRYEPSQVLVNLSNNKLNVDGQERLKTYLNISKLDLSNNNIEEIKWLPASFEELKLDNNRITLLSPEVIKTLRNNQALTNISLKNNPWKCECDNAELQNYLKEFINIKVNKSDIICEDTGDYLLHAKICDEELALKIATPIVVIGLVIVTLLALYFKFNTTIKVYLYSKNWCLWCVAEEEIDKDKTFDVFISYSQKDEHFVEKELLPGLESGDHPFKVCFHHRDWIPGEFISKQIVNSVLDSRRTMVVLSNNFMESVWGKLEFRTAHLQAIKEGRARVIVVLFGTLDEESLDDEIKAYLKTNTYVKWGDPWFWSKLKYALPHSKARRENLSHYSQESFHLS